MRCPPGYRNAFNHTTKGGGGPRGGLTEHTFCHPWKYLSRRFVKESSVRGAREPSLPPDQESQCARMYDGGVVDEGKLKRESQEMVDGLQAISRKPDGAPSHDFHRFLSERRPGRTTRAANLGLLFAVPRTVCRRIPPRCFHLRNMPTPATKKRKADSDTPSTSTSAKVQKSVCFHESANTPLNRFAIPSGPPVLRKARRVQFDTWRVWRITLPVVGTSGP
jgi:hypothetical protein